MNFGNPKILFFLLAVPALAAILAFFFSSRKKALSAFADNGLIERLSSANVTVKKLKALLLLLALTFIILAAARPQFGSKLVEIKQKASDVVIAVDVSKSMLAEDIKPNRLERAKTLLSMLANQLGGNRVGIVAFAGASFWQCPLTLDLASVNLFLDIMDTNLIPLPGTSIGGAIRLGLKGLANSAPGTKAIVLLTDGEDHDSDPMGAAELAASQGVKIFTIGFGSTGGEPIPFKDETGKFAGYKKNKKGEVVMSKMDEALLSKIASTTGGEYFKAEGGNVDVIRIVDGINGLDKRKASSRLNRQLEDRYQYFLFLGLLFLLAEYFIPGAKKRK
jgi:Ca-activated chloride channel family protein